MLLTELQALTTSNQLSLIVALPRHAWAKTSAGAEPGDQDRTEAGAQAILGYLMGEAGGRLQRAAGLRHIDYGLLPFKNLNQRERLEKSGYAFSAWNGPKVDPGGVTQIVTEAYTPCTRENPDPCPRGAAIRERSQPRAVPDG